MAEQTAAVFEQKVAAHKTMVSLRQDACILTRQALEEEASSLSRKGKRFKVLLNIVGAVVATKAAIELAMLNSNVPSYVLSILSILFLLLGLVIAVISVLQGAFGYEETAGRLRTLSSLCKSNARRFMSDYTKYVDLGNPKITLARLQSFIDLQDESLDAVRQQRDAAGVDLSRVKASYRIDGGELATV